MIAPLLKAIRDELRIGLRPLNVDPDCIQVTKDEKVSADIGQVGISIYTVDLTPDSLGGNAVLIVESAVAVGVTLRARFVPVDRRGENLYTDIGDESTISIDELVQRIIRIIHGQPKIVQKASKLGENLGLVYSEPLFIARSIGNPEEKGPDHFNISENTKTDINYNEQDLEALYQEVVFQGAKCFQPALDFEPTLDD